MKMNEVPREFARFISDSPKCEIVILGRKLVDWLLSINTSNRPVKPGVVKRYAEEIDRGEWEITSQGIGISRDGVLIDGQHRLLALRKCGYPPTRSILAWGLNKEAQFKVDVHAKRTVSNIISLALGIQMQDKKAAALRILATIDAGKPLNPEFAAAANALDLVEVYQKYEEEWGSLTFHKGANGPFYAACILAVSSGIPAGAVQRFVDRFADGADLCKGNPILALRSKFQKLVPISGYTKTRDWFCHVARALAAYANGSNLSSFYQLSPADAVEYIRDAGKNAGRALRRLEA